MDDSRKVLPEYDKKSLAELPGTVLKLFDVETDRTAFSEDVIDYEEGFENIVLILVDALGLEQWQSFGSGFFENIQENGELKEITSVFPSATPVTLTSTNTGLTPSEHGLLAWDLYFEEIDENLYTLPFTTHEGEKPQEKHDADPEILFDGKPFYPELEEAGVNCFAAVKRDIADSEFTELTKKGCEIVEYVNTADMAFRIREILENEEGRKYVYGYTGALDLVAHLRGPKTQDEENQLKMMSEALQRNLVDRLSEEVKEDTLLLITADHGQVETGEKIDLLEYKTVKECLERDSGGEIIPASGNGGRSVFLHVKEDKIDELVSFLTKKLEADVYRTEEAVELGLFGEDPGEKFYSRAGDVVIVSDGRKVYWTDTDEIDEKGLHGGLHPEEMRVPLGAVRLSDLE